MESAQARARRELRLKYPDEFRSLYKAERAKTSTLGKPHKIKNCIYSRANNAATTILTHNHWNEYRSLYCQAIEDGHPHTYGWVGRREVHAE